MAPTVFDVLDKKLAELQQSQEEFLAGGGATDFAQYKESTAARREIEDLSRNYTDDIDD
jgi:hypothetical protein